ncbi:hypothetical protein M6D81_23725 [Paenibacillus sp. J5C_2022]|nr:hypothetical protein [Paenibacillus sp. J5C2022]
MAIVWEVAPTTQEKAVLDVQRADNENKPKNNGYNARLLLEDVVKILCVNNAITKKMLQKHTIV